MAFWFSEKPNVDIHIEKLENKFRGRLWSLRHLKRSGMSSSDLLGIYCMIIRPVLDFAAVSYHSMLSVDQTVRLERLQMRALKVIYGISFSYNQLLEKSDIVKLSDRRQSMFVKFALKNSLNSRISEKWFPTNPESGHHTRAPLKYKEFPARTERMLNSPLFQLRKRLNQHDRSDTS